MKKREKDVRQDVGRRFIELRNVMGLTQQQMADRLEVVRTTYVRYENAALVPSFKGLGAIAKDLGISLDWLFMGRGEMFYREPVALPAGEAVSALEAVSDLGPLGNDLKDLFHMMVKNPQLRHKVMGVFYQFTTAEKALSE